MNHWHRHDFLNWFEKISRHAMKSSDAALSDVNDSTCFKKRSRCQRLRFYQISVTSRWEYSHHVAQTNVDARGRRTQRPWNPATRHKIRLRGIIRTSVIFDLHYDVSDDYMVANPFVPSRITVLDMTTWSATWRSRNGTELSTIACDSRDGRSDEDKYTINDTRHSRYSLSYLWLDWSTLLHVFRRHQQRDLRVSCEQYRSSHTWRIVTHTIVKRQSCTVHAPARFLIQGRQGIHIVLI